MNPMQLLTASKSLMGVKDATGRYRMVQGNLLPKFNSTTRMVSPSEAPEARPVKQAMRVSIEDQSTAKPEAPAKILSITLISTRVRAILLKSKLFALAVCCKVRRSVTSVFGKIKPLLCWRGYRSHAKKDKIKKIKPPLQGELSLDRVKVIRNDLSDADLEIIPVVNLEQPKIPPTVSALVTKCEPVKPTWERLTARVFGARQTSF